MEGSVVRQGFLGVPSARAQLRSGNGPVGGSQVLEIELEGSSAPPPAVCSAWYRDPQPGHLQPVARSWAAFCGSRSCLRSPRPLSFPLPRDAVAGHLADSG